MASRVLLSADEVRRRLDFARRRLVDLQSYSGGDLSQDPSKIRLQLLQEFFFHLIGARDVVAQLLNERRDLKIDPQDVSIGQMLKRLKADDPIHLHVASITIDPRRQPFPDDPYSEAGYIYRAINYRNQVVHRHRNPLHYNLEIVVDAATGIANKAAIVHLYLDPRNTDIGTSKVAVLTELEAMHDVLAGRYHRISDSLAK
jgi:hypothetical protein